MGRKHKPVQLVDWVAERDRQVAARFTPQLAKPADKPLTRNHTRYMQAIRDNPIVFSVGPAGCGKTVLACRVAVELLKAGQIAQIVLTRPLVPCGRELGFLPGTEAEKMAPYLAPLAKGISRYLLPGEYDRHLKAGTIKVASLEAMRGETFEQAVVICDEAENATYSQLRMLLTRGGANSKMIVNGDISQADVCPGATNPFARVILKLQGVPGISLVKMTRTDCLRPALVQEIDQRLA